MTPARWIIIRILPGKSHHCGLKAGDFALKMTNRKNVGVDCAISLGQNPAQWI